MYKKTKTITNKPLNEKLILTLPVHYAMFRSIIQKIIYLIIILRIKSCSKRKYAALLLKDLPRLREVYLFPTEEKWDAE